MPLVPILTLIIFGPIIALGFLGAVWDALAPNIVPILVWGGGILGVLILVGNTPRWLREEQEARERREYEAQQARLMAEADAQHRQHIAGLNADLQEKYRLATRQYPAAKDFVYRVKQALELKIKQGGYAEPSLDLWKTLLLAAKDLYERNLPKNQDIAAPLPITDAGSYQLELQRLEPFSSYAQAFDPAEIGAKIVASLEGFLKAIPAHTANPQFAVPIKSVVGNIPQTIGDMTWPFQESPLLREEYNRLWGAARQAGHEADKRLKDPRPVFPQDWKGDPVEAITRYLPESLQALFAQTVPWGIDDELRFTHHHCLGETGAGKSTFLSHEIWHYLKRVANKEASLVVMDSDGLAQKLSKLKIFAKGEPLHDRVIIIDPDPDYPIALNPFRLSTGNAERDLNTKLEILNYAFSTFSVDPSIQQEGVLGSLIAGAAHVPDASLDTLRNLLMPQGTGQKDWKWPYEDAAPLRTLDEDTRIFFEHDMPTLPTPTRNALRRNIGFFRQKRAIKRMFNADRCALDLFTLFQEGGWVILIDTQRDTLGGKNCEAFGRIFIALLDQVGSRRKADDPSLPPVFTVIDEAQDYCETDRKIRDILLKVRKRRMAFTIAHHNWEEIRMDDTRQALRECGIHTQCSYKVVRGKKIPLPAVVSLGVTNPEVHTIPFTKFDFGEDMPKMSGPEYHELRASIFKRFGPEGPEPEDEPEIPLVD